MAEVLVTNFNKNYTGVSSTTDNVIREQLAMHDVHLVGQPLPNAPTPLTTAAARALSRTPSNGRRFVIWHVRRNTEMRAAIWARDVLRLPIKIVFTSAGQRRHSAFPRWLISRMDAIIATSEQAARVVPNVWATVPHGINTDRFFPAEDRAKAWADLGYGGTMGFASMGRIRPEKGTDLYVDTMIHLLPQMPGAVALMTGRTAPQHKSYEDDLRARVAAAGLSDRILFLGDTPADRLPQIVRAVSLIVQLPRHEGFGVVPLEGMASGTPFVGTEAGYYRELSAQGTTGRVLPVDCAPEAAAQAIQELLVPETYARTSDAGRALIAASFSARHEAEGIRDVYERLWAGETQ